MSAHDNGSSAALADAPAKTFENPLLTAAKEAALDGARIASEVRKLPKQECSFEELLRGVARGEKAFITATKPDGTAITNADLLSEDRIKTVLYDVDPGVKFVGEESKNGNLADTIANDICWVVDPIDGTRQFRNEGKHWAVSVALQDHGTSTIAAVYVADDLEKGTLFWAEKGEGAFSQHVKKGELQGKPHPIEFEQKHQKEFPIHGKMTLGLFPEDYPNKRYDAQFSTEAFSSGTIHKGLEMNMKRISGGTKPELATCACADALDVLAGNSNAYVHGIHYPWDDAASSLILQEAGVPMVHRRNEKCENDGLLIASVNQPLTDALEGHYQAARKQLGITLRG